MSAPRGYTLTELVAAASITMVTCVGGAATAQVVTQRWSQVKVMEELTPLLARMDAAAPRGACAVVQAAKRNAPCDRGRVAAPQTVLVAGTPAVLATRPRDAWVDVVVELTLGNGQKVQHVVLAQP